MTDILLFVALALLAAIGILLLILVRKSSKADAPTLASRLDAFEKAQERTERTLREEVAQNRDELGKAAKEQRQELTEAFKTFGDSVMQRMTDVTGMHERLSPISLAPLQRRAVKDWTVSGQSPQQGRSS
jgi:DNA recombination protein RmuC